MIGMNRILKSTRLDFYSAGNPMITMMFYLLLNILVSFIIRNPLYALTTGAMLASTSNGSIFIIHERNHGGKLYGILPLKRHEVVIGRYIYGMIIGVINLVFAYILAFSIGVIFHMYSSFEIMNTCLPPMAAMMFIYYCLVIGTSYPMSFAMGYKSLMSIPIVLIYLMFQLFAIPFLYTMNPSSPGWFARNGQHFLMQLINKYPLFTIGLGLIIGLTIIVISAAIACAIYKRKEI